MKNREHYIIEARCDSQPIYYRGFGWVYELDEARVFDNGDSVRRMRDFMERQSQRSGDVYGVKVVVLVSSSGVTVC